MIVVKSLEQLGTLGHNNASNHARVSCTRRITQTSFGPNYVVLKGAILL